MYAAIKQWINVPIEILPGAQDNGGNKSYGAPVAHLCYPEYKVRNVVDTSGNEVVSSITFYMEGTTSIGTLDRLKFNERTYNIKALECYYRNGVPDIWVVRG